MATPPSGQSDDFLKDLQEDWNVPADSERSNDSPSNHLEIDSLLAFIDPSTQPRVNPKTSPPPPPPIASAPGARASTDAELVHAFSIDADAEANADAEDELERAATNAGLKPSPVPIAPQVPFSRLLPKRGESIGGFLIVGELGRGAFARVYLARQASLGNRLVALKVSPAEGDEPEILARLQHTHIVPIHSVHDDPGTGLRLMCMPYLGGANLAQVLEVVGSTRSERSRGGSLVDALDAASQQMQSRTGLKRSVSVRSFASFQTQSARVSPHAATQANAEANVDNAGTGQGPGQGQGTPTSFLLQSVTPETVRSARSIHSLWTRISGRSRSQSVDDSPLAERESDQPARQFLRGANHIQAAVWIVCRLAEGLDHAHSRGLLHRDLKPSNILITDDGTPMLLDFNLSSLRRLESTEEGARATLGGTLPFMAPEHLDAFHPKGSTPPEAVGESADLYALCLILFEMIAGEPPFTEPSPTLPLLETIQAMINQRRQVPSLRAVCPQVPWSLDSIVAKSLDPVPTRRHARARDLAEDLRRFLEDLPLRYAPEPSPRERVAKWVRRHPNVTNSTSIGLLAIVLLIGMGGIISLLSNNLQGVSARLKFRTFQSVFSECQLRLNTTSGPVAHLNRGITLAQKVLDEEGAGLWDETQQGTWIRWLSPPDQKLLREQIVELILLEARAKTYLAMLSRNEPRQREALEWAIKWLDRAERIDPRPTAALYGDRARYFAALGLADQAAINRKLEAQTPPQTSRDFALLGTTLLVNQNWAQAEVALRRAVELDRRRFWAWFGLGFSLFEQGRYLEAAGNFAVCTALEPSFAWPYMNQGLALANAGQLDEAISAYNQALERNPRFTEALLNRCLTRLELNDLTGAEQDLKQAIKLGRNEPNVLAAQGEILARLGRRAEAEQLYAQLLDTDPENQAYRIARAVLRLRSDPTEAKKDLEHVLERNPRNARALYVMARLVQTHDRAQALGYVDKAIEIDHRLADAIQLRALLRARLGQLSAVDDVDRLLQAPTAGRLYNAACALALLSETATNPRYADRALALLARSLELGFSPALAAEDPDLNTLHSRADFKALMTKPRNAGPPGA